MDSITNQEDLSNLLNKDSNCINEAAFILAATFFEFGHEYLSKEQALRILEIVGKRGIPDAFAVLGDNCNTPDDEECSREVGEYYGLGARLGSIVCKSKLEEWDTYTAAVANELALSV